MPSKVSREETPVFAVLRFMNGPLLGCEYGLEPGKTLFVVGSVGDLIVGEVIPEFPENTVVVPMPQGGINFEVIIDSGAADGFLLRVLTDAPEDRCHLFQDSCTAGDTRFLVRRRDDDWRVSLIESQAPLAIKVDKKVSSLAFIYWLSGLAALFSLVFASTAIWKSSKGDVLSTRVSAAIAGSIGKYQILRGHDDVEYVFAGSERDMAWGRQALIRADLYSRVTVSTLRREESRIVDLLRVTYPTLAFHRLRMEELTQPILMLSQNRTILTNEARGVLIEQIKRWMPYAETVVLDNWDDTTLEQQAGSGLDRLGISYSRARDNSRITFVAQGELTDVDLLNLQKYTKAFYRDFGSEYVHFTVELKDELLKNKSFKYGRNGYVKVTPKHWFFPNG
ncbi:PrgH/EprH family type III secretion apparatus protein [Glaciimonas sp. PAMC28666]|uniref:PrgH/EprH family type III secretion apparatus protein n=1 Tax=Glaciimonas sp. PAMC28666 TaxID=2807626 RepID=UPI001966AF50|nr:PrgH/EprH family type III secretion apparatus protein [Glaciimonas sp. PAMC28666]QRX82152.1 PrgH/EprH family type III secretion apparatus protein [Glaciimonas sp. PAMC28666]